MLRIDIFMQIWIVEIKIFFNESIDLGVGL